MPGNKLKDFICVVSVNRPNNLVKSDLLLYLKLQEVKELMDEEQVDGGTGSELRLQSPHVGRIGKAR